jgi:hypothetical protein
MIESGVLAAAATASSWARAVAPRMGKRARMRERGLFIGGS